MRYLFPLSPWNAQRQFEKPVWIFPWLLASYATWLRDQGHEVVWGDNEWAYDRSWKVITRDIDIDVPFNLLPIPDRVWTDAKNPRWQKYGNYKYHPATHMMSALGCTHGKCSFCYEKDRPYIVRSPYICASEVAFCRILNFYEVFDDSATLPNNDWLKEFSYWIDMSGWMGKITLGCNLRINSDNDFVLMKKTGYRMVLVGIESANQETLDRINKGIKASDIIPVIRKMSEAGLEPHITALFGMEWESHEDAIRTVKLIHYLLKKGYAKTAQASVFSPPRTVPDPKSSGHKYVKQVYDVYKSPEFLWRKLMGIREWADIRYLIRSGRLVLTEKYKPTGK